MELSITLAAYREAANLRWLLPQILTEAGKLTPHFEVLVIDTREPIDDTEAVCRHFGVRHLRRQGGDTYGDAIRTAIAAAQGRFLLNLDADGSHSPEDFPTLWAMREHWDIVIGSRYAADATSNNPRHLVWKSKALNAFMRFRLHLPLHDTTNSFRLYRCELLQFIHLNGTEFDLLPEILFKAKQRHATIGEVPIHFLPRRHDTSKRNTVKLLRAYARLLRNLA